MFHSILDIRMRILVVLALTLGLSILGLSSNWTAFAQTPPSGGTDTKEVDTGVVHTELARDFGITSRITGLTLTSDSPGTLSIWSKS